MNVPNPVFRLMITIIFSLLQYHVQTQLTAKIYQSSKIISSSSSHEIIITFKNTQIPSGSSFMLQYSSAWSLGSVTGGNVTSDYCETGCTISGVQAVINSIAGTAQIKFLFPRLISAGESRTIRYTLKNIVNPSSALSEDVAITLLDNTANWLDLTIANVVVTPKELTCTVGRTVTTVSTQAQYQFSVNPLSLSIPSNLYIMMVFPTSWSSSADATTFNTATFSCRGAPNPSISCNKVNNNINASSILSGSTSSLFSFNVTSIKNPASQENNNQLNLQFYSSGKQIAFCYVNIIGTTARTLSDLNIQLTGSLGANIIGTISFSITEKARTTDIVKIEFPKSYDCSNLYAAFVYLNAETVGRQAVMNVDITSSTTLNIVTLQPFFSDSIALYRIELYNIKLPRTTAAVGQIKVSLSRDGALIASQSCCSNTYSMLSSSSGLSVSLSTSSVGSASTHYITLTSLTSLNEPLSYTQIMIEFDSKYNLVNPTYNCYIRDSLMVIYPLICTRSTTNKILVSNFNSSTKIGVKMYTIGIDSITLPVTLDTLYINLITMDSNSYPIESITASYSLSATKINNVKVVPTLLTTYSTTTYAFIITNTNILSAGTKVSIMFPPEIRLSPSSQCFINGTALSSTNCVIDTSLSTRQSVLLTIGNTVSINTFNLNQTNISISLITNSLSIQQSQSFYIQLLTSLGQIIQELRQGVSVTLTQIATSFALINIINSGANNYTMGVTDYLFQVTLPVDIITVYGNTSSYVTGGIQLVVQLPAQFRCLALITSKPCMVNGQKQFLTYTLTSTPTSSPVQFTIASVINPVTTTIASSIKVQLKLSKYSSIMATTNLIQAFDPSIISYTLSASNYYLSQHTQIYIGGFSIGNWVATGTATYLLIKVPSQYTVDASETITSNIASATIVKSVSGTTLTQIKISGITQLTNLSLTISNIINPSSSPSLNKWQIQFRTVTADMLIAKSSALNDIGFMIVCTLPCRSCTSNTSYCLSCYTSLGTITQKYLDPVARTCIASCQSNQYLSLVSTDLTCYACSVSCLTCMNISSNCTSCSSPAFLYESTNKCVTQCPPQYYQNSFNRKCTDCASPCQYCIGSSGVTCTFCQSSYVLTVYLNGTTTCTTGCPSGYYNHSNVCTKCSTNCNICSAVNQCTTCANGYFIYNGSCFNECPKNIYISVASGNTICQACQSPCSSCLNFSTYCVSCNTATSNKYLMTTSTTSTCTTSCPNQYFADQFMICQACVYPCLFCSSLTACLSCTTGFKYYPNTQSCYSVCPTTTILVTASQQCAKCTSPCLQCTGTTTSCTSCIQSYFLDSNFNVCNSTCNSPYFAINRKCTRCADPCLTCALLQPYTCNSCVSGFFLMGTTCYPSVCPDGSYRSGTNICSSCTSGCLTCINSSSTCLSCYPGLYLYLQSCLPSCPTTPILYYQYQRQCIACQPQCSACISSPVQCSSCSNSSLYFNEVTRQCTAGCTSPYFTGVNSSNPTIKLCIKCRPPCKTCSTSYSLCSSCYNGLYLQSEQCIQTCGSSKYADTETNTCTSCSSNCLTCTSINSCTQCQSGSYSYRGACYTVCPAQAQFVYQGKYCRNCTLDNCLLCDMSNKEDPSCLLCEPSYFLYQKKCISACPDGFEPDSVTQSLCIITKDSALLAFWKKLQKLKVFLLPGSSFFVFILVFCLCYLCIIGECNNFCKDSYIKQQNRHILPNILYLLPAVSQFVSIVVFIVYQIMYPQTYYRPSLLTLVFYALFAFYFALNIIQFVIVYLQLKSDKVFIQWSKTGISETNNPDKQESPQHLGRQYKRYIILMVLSMVLNRKIILFIFTGLFRIPITCCQISGLRLQTLGRKLKIICIFGMALIEIPLIAYSIFNIVIEKHYLWNYKLFYGAIDIAFVNFISILCEIVFLHKPFEIPCPYKKYILQGVSNRSLAAFSEKIHQEPEQDDDLHLHRSNSTEGLKKQSQQMKAVQYKSVFDPSDFQDPDFVEPQKIQNAINHGKFRKKNLKRKKNKGRNLDLDVIDEDSEQQQQNAAKKPKRKQNNKKVKLGYMNNFIYWKPPQKVQKKQPQKQFKMHKQQIMQTIRQKQSDFDTITRNDIIFQEEGFNDNSSHESDPNFQIQDSRRALNYQYQAFINKNYAKRRHL